MRYRVSGCAGMMWGVVFGVPLWIGILYLIRMVIR